MTVAAHMPELIVVPHHELSYDETLRRDVRSYTLAEIRGFDKQAANFYARATGLQETGMSVNEIALLYDLLEKKGKCNIVELGRNFGTSTRLFLQHVLRHGGWFESWDLKHWGNLEDTFAAQGFVVNRMQHAKTDDYDYGLSVPGAKENLAAIRVANSVMTDIEDKSRWVDFLLIDTEHGIENALGEYMRWRNYMNSGSFVAFHDSSLPGVMRAIEIIKETEASTCGNRLVREWKNEREDGFGVAVLEWLG